MPVREEKYITRMMMQNEPDVLFVFGDNFARSGTGGQAREMRGEPNAVGIPTKRLPGWDDHAYLTDASLEEYVKRSEADYARLHAHLDAGGTVVLPADGIGTGLAELERRAPLVWEQLCRDLDELREIGGTVASSG